MSIVAKPKETSPPSTPNILPHLALTASHSTSEEVLEQVLKSPRLLEMILSALHDNVEKRGISDEVLSTIRQEQN